ncbi:cytochrome P450 [Auriscalpium vulgare]|uniref:Cytochrome P450 n=1 Tax=Auriscalpium vulgare TaxID=40419 RepID=A0ACB8SBA8_9AGAM|nr:cytochrome P450 [Auriscalpium vulgare]
MKVDATWNAWPVVGAAVLALTVWWWLRSRARAPFFPGPKGLPVVGNIFNLPKPGKEEWIAYAKMGNELGTDIVHLNVLGSHLVVVNSAKAANDLFEKRSLKLDWILGFLPYGQKWRNYRKAFHEHFNPTTVHQYKPLEVKSAHQLLFSILTAPESFMDSIRHMAGHTIISIAYGIDVKPANDPYVLTAEKTLHSVALAASQGGHLDMMPWLADMPWWVPGAGFKKVADECHHYGVEMLEAPFAAAKAAVAAGKAAPSVATSRISQLDANSSASDRTMAKILPGNVYLGYPYGVIQTVSAIQTFFLAMVLHPEAQKRAQAEIDSVVGTDRLPDFDDEDSLPYVKALVKEVLRWHPVVPLAIPHRLEVDDVYDGHLIPGGSVVLGNAWAMLHDKSVFPEPSRFLPEHFLKDSDLFPDFAFGFGRRACPGRYMAWHSVWIAVVSVLAAYDISPAVDEHGQEVSPSEDYRSGIVSYPERFPCRIKPRTKTAEDLIIATQNIVS